MGGIGARLCAIFALVATSLVAQVGAGAPAQAWQASGENGRIAYMSGNSIWTMNPDGSRKIQITFPGELWYDTDPEWSPNGRKIAFTRTFADSDNDRFERRIWTVNSNGGNSVERTSVESWGPTWSPDGNRLAFEKFGGCDTKFGSCRRIAVLDLATGGTTNYPTGGIAGDPSWSPDGSHIAYVFGDTAATEGQPSTFGVRAARYPWDGHFSSYDVTELTGGWSAEAPYRVGAADPAWSPDGLRLAYTRFAAAEGAEDTVVWNDVLADGETAGEGFLFHQDQECVGQAAWSPDGQRILCTSNVTTIHSIAAVTTAGAPIDRVDLGSGRYPSWDQVRGRCQGEIVTSFGTIFDDTIYGTLGDDVIAGLSGADRIIDLTGNDLICGGDGGDHITGSDGNDILRGQGGADTVKGQDGSDIVSGGPGLDALYGGRDSDILDGEDGFRDRYIDGGFGTDIATWDRGLDPKPLNVP